MLADSSTQVAGSGTGEAAAALAGAGTARARQCAGPTYRLVPSSIPEGEVTIRVPFSTNVPPV